MAKQRNDATASAQGMVFQFFAALYACFEMNEGDKVYIEKYGDVTTISPECSTQVEVKKRAKRLNNHSDEIWNSIYNWLKAEISWKDFSNLILLTTQNIASSSVWAKWNGMSGVQRLAEFNKLLRGSSKQSSESKSRLSEINSILKDDEREEFVRKLIIDSAEGTFDYWKRKLRKYIKGVPELRVEDCLNSLLGFITQKSLYDTGWIINSEDFSSYMEDLCQSLTATTSSFPLLVPVDTNLKDYQEKVFIKKLREIRYEDTEVLQDAAVQYATAMLYNSSFSFEPHRMRIYEEYEENICEVHKQNFRKAKNKCQAEIFKSSREFYDDFMCHPVENLGSYTNTPIRYRNGVVQILANENRISWLLRPQDVNLTRLNDE